LPVYVVGELFWFAGKLGRARVCALRKSLVRDNIRQILSNSLYNPLQTLPYA
jgi:hypothetical protein